MPTSTQGLLAACLAVSTAGCSTTPVDLGNFACSANECLAGYSCHPERSVCVPSIAVGCDDPHRTCPEQVKAGDACSSPGSFLPCASDVSDCSLGCLTCEGGAWSGECTCELGLPKSCASCGDDCTRVVLHATAVCLDPGGAPRCDYGGGCLDDYVDADADRSNGCECQRSNGGVERCDGIDNDCDGRVDQGVFACQCDGGAPSVEVCDDLDNDCDGVVDDGFACHGLAVRDCNGGAGAEPCDAATCAWSGVCTPKDPTAPMAVSDLAASAGDGVVELSYTTPSDSDLAECVVMRKVGAAPTGHTDGTLVAREASPVPDATVLVTDGSVANGVTYQYAVYCRDLSGNWQEATGEGNVAVATPTAGPPARVADLNASDGDDGSSLVTFTTPVAPVTACALLRKIGGYANDHLDGAATTVATFSGAAMTVSHSDGGLSNGTTYYYVAYCHNQATWNDVLDDTPPARNADTALPTPAPPTNPTDVQASDGGDGASTITFTMPAAPVSECVLRRKRGDAAPVGHADGVEVAVGLTGAGSAKSVQDAGLVNGARYTYAVFCVNDGTWNETVTSGANTDTALLCAGTITVSAAPHACDPWARGSTDETLLALTISSSACTSQLDSLVVTAHASADARTGGTFNDVRNVRVVEDTDGDGDFDVGEPVLSAPAEFSGGAVQLAGIGQALPPATPVALLVVGDVATLASLSYFAATLAAASDVGILTSEAVMLSSEPLVGEAHAVHGLASGSGFVVPSGGRGVASALTRYAVTNPTPASWAGGAGDEADWAALTTPFTSGLADRSLNSPGGGLWSSDHGVTSGVLHLDTGMPLGLPVCGVSLRLYGAEEADGSNCLYTSLSDFTSARVFAYTGDTTVHPTGSEQSISALAGPVYGSKDCVSHYVDLDLSTIYPLAEGASFHVRVVVEAGDGIDVANGNSVGTHPEIYVSVTP